MGGLLWLITAEEVTETPEAEKTAGVVVGGGAGSEEGRTPRDEEQTR